MNRLMRQLGCAAIALLATFMIMVIILAVLALIVVKALTGSPWGSFTVLATIPIALFMGVYSWRRAMIFPLSSRSAPSWGAGGCALLVPAPFTII